MLTTGEHILPHHLADHALDAIQAHIAIIDQDGTILAVNEPWIRFAHDNGAIDLSRVGVGANYLRVCQADRESRSAHRAHQGLISILSGRSHLFQMDYFCPSPEERHWYTMQATPLNGERRMAVIAHADMTRRKLLHYRLLRRVERLARQMTDIEQAERRRIGSQLHDHLQQLLVAAKFALAATPVDRLDADSAKYLNQARHHLDEAVKATRALSRQIQPVELEQQEFARAMDQLATQHEQLHHVPVECYVFPDDLRLPEAVAAFVYHATRELLFNAVKHAEPTRQWVSLTQQGKELTLTVADDGRGADPQHLLRAETADGGTGLAAIRQRLEYFRGQIKVDTAPGHGTAVTLIIPLKGGFGRRRRR